ncbi:MAG: acetamidase/formamidase family protein [Halanaeroarchaeum sp.]
MSRRTVSPDDGHVFEFQPDLEPVYAAADGESLTIETMDSLGGAIQTDEDRLDAIPEEVNAATGPIAVENARPGDVLRVEIEDVRVTEDRGRVVTTPDFGLLQDDESIEHPFTKITPVEGDAVTFEDLSVAIEPVVGTIGVAPASASYSTLTPHDHGGNLDTTDVTAGTTVYFPVFQEGAMLAMGDAKAAMADGEMCGTGAEIATAVDLTVEVVEDPGVAVERPLLDTGDAWKTIASAETMETAAKRANRDAVTLIEHATDLSRTEAYAFASLVGGLEISQVVDPLVTVRNAVPAEYLGRVFE